MTKLLYIGNLPFTVTAAELTRLVKPHGEVLNARIGLDKKTHKSRGFGFVEVPDREAPAVIAALHGTKFHGRQLKVNISEPHPSPKDRSWKDRDRMDYEEVFDDE
jgi:RNA recognition motif-containing protein